MGIWIWAKYFLFERYVNKVTDDSNINLNEGNLKYFDVWETRY